MVFLRTLRAACGMAVVVALLFGSAPVAFADWYRQEQWPLKSFDADAIGKVSTGRGVTVAVLDDPVNGNHPDLKGNVLPGKNFEVGGRGDRMAGNAGDHGTAMASLIAGHGHGVGHADGVMGLAPDAKILPVAIPEYGLGEDGSSLSSWIRYAVDQGASVINMSIGGSDPDGSVGRAVAYALEKDVVVVAGSGNDGKTKLDDQALATTPGLIAVGAVSKDGKVWTKSNSGAELMLTAPGVDIVSASPKAGTYREADGTSDSTAYVSAAAALLRSKFPHLTAGQIANRLVKTAGLPPGEENLRLPDPHYGYGMIRPYSALTKDVPAGSRNGPLKMPKADPSPGVGTPPNSPERNGSGLSPLVIIAIAIGGLVVVAVIAIVAVRQKNSRNRPFPGGPGGGGPGFPLQQPGPYPQPSPYPQPGPYQQQPIAPQQRPYPQHGPYPQQVPHQQQPGTPVFPPTPPPGQ
ncbi:S8 family serine peptidase [Streptomyces decoyicus]|uniref:S8 family serine peptidase n=1 Tax=Streptomyces decoyicus TaxID=249567 RepID=UPI00386C64C8